MENLKLVREIQRTDEFIDLVHIHRIENGNYEEDCAIKRYNIGNNQSFFDYHPNEKVYMIITNEENNTLESIQLSEDELDF